MTQRILIAGIGNIFHGDDAFGVEVAQHLMKAPLPEGVHVADFGIRSYDLAFALMDGYDTAILVDATQQGQPPGTLYLIEPDLDSPAAQHAEVINGHSLNPVRVLQMVKLLGGQHGRLYVVGCEPAALNTPDGRIGLSGPVSDAIPEALAMIRRLLEDLMQKNEQVEPGRLKAHHA